MGRARGSSCGAVYETALAPYRPRYITRAMPWRVGRVASCSSMAIGRDHYVIAFTMEPRRRYRLRSRVCSDSHRILTAMKMEQVRERERYRRKTRCSGPFTRKKVPTRPPIDGVDLGGRLSLCVHRFLRLRPSAGGPTCGVWKREGRMGAEEKYWFLRAKCSALTCSVLVRSPLTFRDHIC